MSILLPLLIEKGLIDDPETAHLPTAQDVSDFQQHILKELITHGLGLVRCISQNATNAVYDREPLPDTALAYERICRAVRRTIILSNKLDDPSTTTAEGCAADAQPQPAKTPVPRTHASKTPTPEPTTPETIDRDRPEPPEPSHETFESDHEPAFEDETDRQDDLDAENPDADAPTDRPIPEQIAAIRRDLGLPPLAPTARTCRGDAPETHPNEPAPRPGRQDGGGSPPAPPPCAAASPSRPGRPPPAPS